ncbi:hypothetical protein BKA67DRAFT_584089 [Truncatella angustata]|uniref:Uncharacterized protein n=1 Tax=Truncatella angustata TaxID=152316 RepID=A0A9P8RNB6_9PEZI|nr:uncharacterized protein BKA67DRAFT_584089 [Truncatella angustata]KAH6646375.1 hypothetical protein BKA67DRAFT_584089 [Truncatella angustata]
MTGEATDIALRKSMYAIGGLMGVLVNSSLKVGGTADKGVLADRAESSEGNVAVTGVVNCGSLGLLVGFMSSVLTVECLSAVLCDVIYRHKLKSSE